MKVFLSREEGRGVRSVCHRFFSTADETVAHHLSLAFFILALTVGVCVITVTSAFPQNPSPLVPTVDVFFEVEKFLKLDSVGTLLKKMRRN